MAEASKISRCCSGVYSTGAIVQFLCFLLSIAIAKEITDEILPEQSNSSFPASFGNLVTSAAGSRKRTSRWRLGPSNVHTTYSTSSNEYQKLWNTTLSSMPFKPPDVNSSATMTVSPEPRAVSQQLWDMLRKSAPADELHRTSIRSDTSRISHSLEVRQSEKMNTHGMTDYQAASVLEPFQARTDAVPVSSAVASDVFGFDHHQNREKKLFDEHEDHVSDYNDGENEDYEDEENEDDDDDDDDDYSLDEDERDEYYSDDYPYDEDGENGQLRGSEDYEGNGYRDSVGDVGHQYFREGNLRLPINYTDGMLEKEYGLEYEHDYQLHLTQNHPPDPGNREIRRLVIGGKSNQIDTSLLVIYAWLGLVVIMIAITVVIFKYKQQLSVRCLKITSSCRKVRQVIGIEEGNNLLSHPLV